MYLNVERSPSRTREKSGAAAIYGDGLRIYAIASPTDFLRRVRHCASAQRYSSVSAELLATISSFGPLTDRAALAAQPRRIDIVKLPRSMTLQEFASAYATTVDIKTLALINQVPNASTPLPAGKRMKRVIEK
jgi:predicted Zn-dependent protease